MDQINQQPISPLQTPASVPTPAPTPSSFSNQPEHKKTGLLIAILVVVLLLIIGALYIFATGSTVTLPDDSTVGADQDQYTDEIGTNETTVTPVTNTSDDVGSLEADLNTSVDGLDAQNF